jgi:hypothetical protein
MALGVMLIDFGYMIGGKASGVRTAQFYFAGSLRWTVGHLRQLLVIVLASAVATIMRWIVRPITYRLWRALRRLSALPRGWLRS